MKVELTPDAAQWVEAELDARLFPTAKHAVRYAVNHAKISGLRAEIKAVELQGENSLQSKYAAMLMNIMTPFTKHLPIRRHSMGKICEKAVH
ncbi:MAG: hypothetical protein L7F77_06825 [Candidatus Magnetominusculus sp. LBB02]|nr:hypothetical protein [Candidatus Magnetominusculus sp. LBB02]